MPEERTSVFTGSYTECSKFHLGPQCRGPDGTSLPHTRVFIILGAHKHHEREREMRYFVFFDGVCKCPDESFPRIFRIPDITSCPLRALCTRGRIPEGLGFLADLSPGTSPGSASHLPSRCLLSFPGHCGGAFLVLLLLLNHAKNRGLGGNDPELDR